LSPHEEFALLSIARSGCSSKMVEGSDTFVDATHPGQI
jgi:hypothetical protein